ncbi:MAG: ElyC/SanA/YdcF family protein [Candidatus Microgenomates bacterium]|jgi:hypothetical protein
MEGESVNPTVETEQRPQFDAILVHSFLISRIKDPSAEQEPFKGSLRSRLAARAAALLYYEGLARNIVVVGGKVKGPSYPSTASVIMDELVNKYNVPKENIFMNEEEYNTEEEIGTLSKLSKEKGWSNVASISFRTHEKFVRDILSSVPREIRTSFISIEGIINKYDDPVVQRLVKRLNSSKYQWEYKAYEGTKVFLRRKLPGVYRKMLKKNEQLRRTKNKSGELTLHGIDVFKS